jgi:NADP-dependent 3-hydroxy acid dehydrogenase YdfG
MPGWKSVHNLVFLITGASTGIGAATARLASEHGYRLVLASRDGERLQALADELGGPSRALTISCDVTDWQQVKSLADHTAEVFGRLDAAFVNAGVFSGAPLLGDHDTPQEWRQMVLTNVYGAAITAHTLWPLLKASHGHLILTGSVAGRVTVPGSLYSATKWAITGLAQSLRAAAAGSHARVTVVHPGLVDAGDIAPDRQTDPKLAPEDVARAVLFALTQPPAVDINEIVIRPAGQDPTR